MLNLLRRGFIGLIALLALAGAQAQAFNGDGGQKREGDLRLVVEIENGTTGILRIKAVYEVNDTGDSASIVMVATHDGFDPFVAVLQQSVGPVLADLDGTQVQIVLRVGPRGDHLLGRVLGTNQRVYVVPDDAADDGHCRLDDPR